MIPITPGFATFRGPVDKASFAPILGLWQRLSKMPRQLRVAAVTLPDRGRGAMPDDVPVEFFRFPPF